VPCAQVVRWLSGKLRVERGIVLQTVGDVKTIYYGRTMSIDPHMLAVLQSLRQGSRFSNEADWIFASTMKLGRLPISYPHVWLTSQEASARAGIGELGTHT
jgi:hypothetical protein